MESKGPKQKQKNVAIVVPIYKGKFSPQEEVSYRHLMRFLGKYDKFSLMPESLKGDWPALKAKRFADKCFKNIRAYDQLMMSEQFYKVFGQYEYILIYQLDCLVFSDQLQMWCEADFDYIGAPWLKDKDNPSGGFSRVGNGGFSLRKVASFLKVLNSQRYLQQAVPYCQDMCFSQLKDVRDFSTVKRLIKKARIFREVRKGVSSYITNYTLNEDHFWSDRAKIFYPDFRIAPVEEGLKFSFEAAPGYCFEQSNHVLPFGCHSWYKHGKDFWQSYLIR